MCVVLYYAADAFGKLFDLNFTYILHVGRRCNLRSRVCILYARAVNTRATKEEEETREG